MKSITLRMALASTLALSAVPAFAQETLIERPNFATGEEAWTKTCARCHSTIDDKHDQSVGPYLADMEHDQDTIKFFVRNGFLAMPSFRHAQIDDATLDKLADYIVNEVQKGAAQ